MKTQSKEVFKRFTDEATFNKIYDCETVSEMWKKTIAAYAKKTAIVDDGKEYTYEQLEADAADFRAVLLNNGVKKGDTVCLFSMNSYDFVKAYIAIVTSGCTAAILPAHLDEMSVFGCCMKFRAAMLVYHPGLAEKTNIAKAKAVKMVSTADKAGTAAPIVETKGSDNCVIMFTGGTTGKSKGALLDNTAVMQGTINGCYGIPVVFEQRYILVLPLSHVFGLIRNLMTSLYTGSSLLICRNNKDMFKDCAIFKPTILVAVPALVEMALNLSKQFGKNMLGPDMKTIICGAAFVSPYLIKEYNEVLGITVYPGYGLTESANLVSGNGDCLRKPESVGLMYPNQEYKIVNNELWLKGMNMFKEYVGDPEETQNAFEDGWFKTGDLVKIDDEGLLYITGRIKEIIVLPTGENISPAELEIQFNKCTLIQDSQVYEDMTETGKHFLALEVVPRATELAKQKIAEPGPAITAELQKINATLPAFAQVSKIIIRDKDFDRTPAMKILRYHKCN